MTEAITLFELNSLVRGAIESLLPMSYWVQAELSECRESRGHCYMELVEKQDNTNTPIARASAKCWRNTWMRVRTRFERITGQPLRAGQQVMLLVHAQFHEAYGFSWIVDDINPEFTLGDMARRRQEIIARLKAEGIFDLQKELELPLLTQRVAVISSATAAGYGDFCHQLEDNQYGLRFHAQLFPAIMQGEQVEESVIAALNAIAMQEDEFDVVVIIRGGGGTADMSGFETLALAENVAQFPVPIITGIGHDRDECVLDMVAHTRVKTPTAAAALLVEHQYGVLCMVNDCRERVGMLAHNLILESHERVQQISASLPLRFLRIIARQELKLTQMMSEIVALTHQKLKSYENNLKGYEEKVNQLSRQTIEQQKHRLELLAMRVQSADPQRILDRGYSLTMVDGHAVKDASQLKLGTRIRTRVAHGEFESVTVKMTGKSV